MNKNLSVHYVQRKTNMVKKVNPIWIHHKYPTLQKKAAEKTRRTLAAVGQWFEHQPENWRVAGSILCQDTRLGCGPGPQLGAYERQLTDVSLPLSLPLFGGEKKD